MKKKKHRRDYKHTPGGMQAGNIRYKRNRRDQRPGDEKMGKVRDSRV